MVISYTALVRIAFLRRLSTGTEQEWYYWTSTTQFLSFMNSNMNILSDYFSLIRLFHQPLALE